MNKIYEQVKLRIVLFDEQDCVRTSGVGVQWNSEWTGYFSTISQWEEE